MHDDQDLYTKLVSAAVDIARRGVDAGQSPFGAVIANRDGEIIAAAHNTVRADHDATAHAEINAIRAACAQATATDLHGYVMATTCEPCPMCAAAIHWARLDAVIYGADIGDARRAGFNELALSAREVYRIGGSAVRIIDRVETAICRSLFDLWLTGPNPTPY
jgi:guanine deaminase